MVKAKYMAYEVKRMGSPRKVGKAATRVRLMLMEVVLKPTLLANTETWCKVGEKEAKEWKKWQYSILRILMEQKTGTPYWGIIAETGSWPYQYIVMYKMFMFTHNLINSDESRIARKILIRQSKLKTVNYYNTLKTFADKLEVNMSIKNLQQIKKSQWKTTLKQSINKQILNDIKKETEEKTKMRFVKKESMEPELYVKHLNMKEVSTIMRLKLNMVDTKANFPNGDDRTCIMCGMAEETTEHLFQCARYRQLTGHNLEWSADGEHWTNLQWLKEAACVVERIEEIRERELKRQ